MISATSPKPSLATRRFTIPAGASLEYVRKADFLTCLSATATFAISMDNAPQTDFESGLTYRPENGVHKIEIINLSAIEALSVQLAFGKGNIQDNRAAFSGSLNVQEDMPDIATSGAPVSAPNGAATLLFAANAMRREAIMTNEGAGKVYIGGSAVAAAGEGLPLDAGQTLILSTSAALYARNDTGAAVPVAIMELERAP